jgi:DNA mismatch endonuclease (patch repair protein)
VAKGNGRETRVVPFKRGEGFTTVGRSRLMSRVRQAKTAPEEAVATWLRDHSVRYRRNVRTLPGRPDFANQKLGFAIFVHGCYWHQHPGCDRATVPVRNHEFWARKFAANVARDRARLLELESRGLRTVVVWECETATREALERKLKSLCGTGRAVMPPSVHSGPSGGRPTVGAARESRARVRVGSEGALL